MSTASKIVLDRDRHLKWPALDRLELVLMVLCGIALAGFSCSVVLDIVTRSLRSPWLWLQEVTSAFFIYGASGPDWPLEGLQTLLDWRARRSG